MADTENTDRAERAFRDAFERHAAQAPSLTEPVRLRRRRWAVALPAVAGVVAAVTAAVIVVPMLLPASDDTAPTPPATTVKVPEVEGQAMRWVSYRDLEVQAPAGWEFDYDAVRPDCINRNRKNPAKDRWARDVPTSPYVMVGVPMRGIPAIGCFPKSAPGDPGPEFGAPYALWQPYVRLDAARPDLDSADRVDGEWVHDGWRLTRQTLGEVQVSVLASPQDPDLAEVVLASARTVAVTDLGCEVDSPVAAGEFTTPATTIPAPEDVGAVTICEYARNSEDLGRMGLKGGLEGSRRIEEAAARTLTEAIVAAPMGGGPDRPQNCAADMYGDRAIALRFFGSTGDAGGSAGATDPIGEAYVYYDWCFGNGIVDADGIRRLTRDSCAPLFTQPPVDYWGGSAGIYKLCWSAQK